MTKIFELTLGLNCAHFVAREGGCLQRNRDCAHFVYDAREWEESGRLELESSKWIWETSTDL